jgi:hypothetical protein
MNDSTSREIHKLSIAVGPDEETTFCVQEAYLSFVNNLDENSGIGIHIDMDIETLEPWNIVYKELIEQTKQNKTKQVPSRNEIDTIRDRRIILTVNGGSGKSTDQFWKMVIKEPQRVEFGLYERLWPEKLNHLVPYDYLLIPKGAINYSEIIGCNQGAMCVLFSPYTQLLKYELRFSEKYLSDLPNLRSRLDSFIQNSVCI